jgi:hypothetical protein
VAFWGGRALACWFRRRDETKLHNVAGAFPRKEKSAMTRASSPAREAHALPTNACSRRWLLYGQKIRATSLVAPELKEPAIGCGGFSLLPYASLL